MLALVRFAWQALASARGVRDALAELSRPPTRGARDFRSATSWSRP